MNKTLTEEATLETKRVLYSCFKSVLKYYKEQRIVKGELEEIAEFNSLMEFVYIGRKERIIK